MKKGKKRIPRGQKKKKDRHVKRPFITTTYTCSRSFYFALQKAAELSTFHFRITTQSNSKKKKERKREILMNGSSSNGASLGCTPPRAQSVTWASHPTPSPPRFLCRSVAVAGADTVERAAAAVAPPPRRR